MGVDIVSHELFLVCGALAWGYDLKKKIGEDGKELLVKDMEYSSLLIAKPDWFPFDLTVRSDKKKRMIVDMWDQEVKREWEEEKAAALSL
jgi:hypothetical protein